MPNNWKTRVTEMLRRGGGSRGSSKSREGIEQETETDKRGGEAGERTRADGRQKERQRAEGTQEGQQNGKGTQHEGRAEHNEAKTREARQQQRAERGGRAGERQNSKTDKRGRGKRGEEGTHNKGSGEARQQKGAGKEQANEGKARVISRLIGRESSVQAPKTRLKGSRKACKAASRD